MKLEEENGLHLWNLVCVKVEEEVLWRESCDAGHAMLRHVGPDVAARGTRIVTFSILIYTRKDRRSLSK